MKVLNKNNKLKYSKMFIDEDIYEKICQKHGTNLKEHLKKMDTKNISLDMVDLEIIYEVYSRITKIIHKRRKKK